MEVITIVFSNEITKFKGLLLDEGSYSIYFNFSKFNFNFFLECKIFNLVETMFRNKKKFLRINTNNWDKYGNI